MKIYTQFILAIIIFTSFIFSGGKFFASDAFAADSGGSLNTVVETGWGPDVVSNANFELNQVINNINTSKASLDSLVVGGRTFGTTQGMQNSGIPNMIMINLIGNMIGNPTATASGQAKIGGALGMMNKMVGYTFEKPVSSVQYFADIGRNIGIAQPAYAQASGGFGFNQMSKILPIWKVFRDIAYVFFALIFVLVGLAIMFRMKINPQTVISIQSAIPNLIISLLLVTFSYAIAGFLIDLIYLLIGLGVQILAPIADFGVRNPNGTQGMSIAETQKDMMSMGFGRALTYLWGGGGQAWVMILKGTVQRPDLTWQGNDLLGTSVNVAMEAVANAGVIALGGIIGNTLGILIFCIIAIFSVFKLFLSLIKNYVNIVMLIILAPLQIMMGAIPGSQTGFGSWLRNILSHILVFPAVAIFVLLGWLLTGTNGPRWAPPVLSLSNGEIIPALLGLAMLLMLPKVPDMVRDALQVKPFPYGTGIGEIGTAAGMYPVQHMAQSVKDTVDSGGGGTWEKGANSFFNVLRVLGKIK